MAKLTVDEYDDAHGRYQGREVRVTPDAPVPAAAPAAAEPPYPGVYSDRAQGLSDEERTGLDVVPKLSDPIPFLKR